MSATRRSSKAPERGYSNVPFATREGRTKSVSRLQSQTALHAYRKSIVEKNPSRTWNTDAPTLLKDVLGTRLSDLKDFTVPVFEKTAEEVTQIKNALQQNFIFADLNSTDLNSLIQAFEPFKAPKDTLIIEQGETGDYFYVISEGRVTFEVNNAAVGCAGAGMAFGELALLYSCPRAATVVASSELTKPTKLFRVDQTTFRAILQKQTEKLETQKASLLKSVHYLSDILSSDLKRLGRVMIPLVFEEGDCLIKKGGLCDTFFVLQEGEVTSSENSTLGSSLKAGDCFGGEALASLEPSDVDVTATTKGMAWSINQATFQKVFGNLSRLLMRSKARHILASMTSPLSRRVVSVAR
jgi:cAMP-dependent protein kinase regulator